MRVCILQHNRNCVQVKSNNLYTIPFKTSSSRNIYEHITCTHLYSAAGRIGTSNILDFRTRRFKLQFRKLLPLRQPERKTKSFIFIDTRKCPLKYVVVSSASPRDEFMWCFCAISVGPARTNSDKTRLMRWTEE